MAARGKHDWPIKHTFLRVAVLFVTTGFAGPVKVDKQIHVTVLPCASWDTALSACRSSRAGLWLPVIRNRKDYRFVADQMTFRNISVTWLGLRRQHLGHFIWTDCSHAPEQFVAQRWPEFLKCGFLNIHDESLDGGNCGVQKGVICEVRDCSQCALVECVRIRGRCFYQTCTPMTWEAGRAYCSSRGWDLAVLDNTDEKQLGDMFVEALKDASCRFYWVGLRREEWVYQHLTSKNITSVHWASDEPGLSGDCAVMIRKGGGYEWRAVSCEERHQVLCYDQQSSVGKMDTAFMQSCRSWQVASSTCEYAQKDSQLPVLLNTDDVKSVSQMMGYYKINTTWLALTKRHLENFLWLDCKNAPSEFTAQKWSTTTNCGFLNTRDNLLEADTCSNVKGVICEIKDCTKCVVMECTHIEGRCFYASCTPMTWEAARAYCRSFDWSLTVLSSTDEGSIRKMMVRAWKDNSCQIYWLGLRREEWVYPNNAHLGLIQVHWDLNEPRDTGQCSIMVRTKDTYIWRVADCNDRHPALCVRSHRVHPTSTSLKPQVSSKFPESTNQFPSQSTVVEKEITYATESKALYGILPVTFMLFIISLATSIYIVRKRCPEMMIKKSPQIFQLTKPKTNWTPQVDDRYFYTEEMRNEQKEPKPDMETLMSGGISSQTKSEADENSSTQILAENV